MSSFEPDITVPPLASTTQARILQRLSDELDGVIHELGDPVSDAIDGFTQ